MWRGLGRPRLGRNRGPQGFGPGCRVHGLRDASQWKRHSRPRPSPLAVPPLGGELHTHPPPPHPPTPPPSLLSVLRTGVWVRVRGVRFACEAPRTGWNGTKGQETTSDPADLAKSAKCWVSCSAPPRGPGGPGIARARRDLSNALYSPQIHAGLSKSMWHPRAERGPGAGRFVRALGPFPLCVVSGVRANRNDTSDRALGPAAERTL